MADAAAADGAVDGAVIAMFGLSRSFSSIVHYWHYHNRTEEWWCSSP